jgi:hypothetical protein
MEISIKILGVACMEISIKILSVAAQSAKRKNIVRCVKTTINLHRFFLSIE